MRRIAELLTYDLKWTQPQALKMEYELHADGELVATLRFKSTFGTLATAESADGSWTFKRVGFFKTHVTIRVAGSDENIAVFKNNAWTSGGILELADGRKFPASTNFWQTQYELKSEAGEPLLRFKNGGFLHLSAEVTILPQAASLPELPWIMALGLYLIVMLRNDAAVAAAV